MGYAWGTGSFALSKKIASSSPACQIVIGERDDGRRAAAAMSLQSMASAATQYLAGKASSKPPAPTVVKRGRHRDSNPRVLDEDVDLKPWGRMRSVEHQEELARQHEQLVDRLMLKPPSLRCDKRSGNGWPPRPRVYVYELPPRLLPPAQAWRMVRAVKVWVEASRYYEPNPFCADYYLVPSHPQNREARPAGERGLLEIGDLRMARAFAYIRDRLPFWNRTVRAGTPRHFLLLPCDHGPGDCAYTRPNVPYKYAPSTPSRYPPGTPGKSLHNKEEAASAELTFQRSWRAIGERSKKGGSPWWPRSSHAHGAKEIEQLWGRSWELINPASPARLVFYLQFNGWADGLNSRDGGCLNCFTPGLDIRLPTPEGHECGVSCGLHYTYNASSKTSWFIPAELQRMLLRRAASQSPSVHPERRLRRPPSDGCVFSWAGAVRGRNSPSRFEVLKLIGTDGACVTNTATGSFKAGDKPVPSIPIAMSRGRFCFSPRGWDQGDSDRYLPALLYGCIPIMSDRFEGMPLDELPEMAWSDVALALDKDQLPHAVQILRALPSGLEKAMRNASSQMIPRMLYTSFEFSSLPTRVVNCNGCSRSRTDCHGMRGSLRDSVVRKMAPLAHELKIDYGDDLSRHVCGQTSYFGEDGSHDAFQGVMDILRRRLRRPPAPLEPWVGAATDAEAQALWPLSREWFARRSAYYQIQRAAPPHYTLLRAQPPAAAYRKALAVELGVRAVGAGEFEGPSRVSG